jgi:hypothetical protein
MTPYPEKCRSEWTVGTFLERKAAAPRGSRLVGQLKTFAGEGITCNGISPGPLATEMNRPLLENAEANAQFLANIPLVGGAGGGDRAVAVYLCSEESGFITGTDILIDGAVGGRNRGRPAPAPPLATELGAAQIVTQIEVELHIDLLQEVVLAFGISGKLHIEGYSLMKGVHVIESS